MMNSKGEDDERKLKIDNLLRYIKETNTQHPAIRANEVKSQYQLLKRLFQTVYAKHMLFENLHEMRCPSENELKKQLKECNEQNSKVKDEISDRTTHVRDMSQEAEDLLTKYNALQEKYQSTIAAVQNKRRKVEEQESKFEGVPDVDAFDIKKIQELQNDVARLENLEGKWRTELSELKREETKTQAAVEQLERDVDEVKTSLEKQESNSKVEKLKAEIDQLSALQCITVHSVTPSQVVLHIYTPETQSTGKEKRCLELKVGFIENNKGESRMSGAQTNLYSLNIEDLVLECVQNGSLLSLVEGVKQMWYKSYRLVDEVELMREKYALDWLADKGHVNVLYGETMCTLEIGSRYPEDRAIALTRVTGSSGISADISVIKPPQDNPSLSEWLEYLETLLMRKPNEAMLTT